MAARRQTQRLAAQLGQLRPQSTTRQLRPSRSFFTQSSSRQTQQSSWNHLTLIGAAAALGVAAPLALYSVRKLQIFVLCPIYTC